MVGWIRFHQKQKCQKYIFINVWRKNVFDIHFTELGAVMTTVLPVLFKYCYKYCYRDATYNISPRNYPGDTEQKLSSVVKSQRD
jgi:hypothetical protein